ncbi:hypothetical protein C414_000420039 [Campylobacter jejuni subsp. jejuni 414]|nr:hypothetical protein C414_000420039 [Campylobacter jejuni subsp. jejuni 414]
MFDNTLEQQRIEKVKELKKSKNKSLSPFFKKGNVFKDF